MLVRVLLLSPFALPVFLQSEIGEATAAGSSGSVWRALGRVQGGEVKSATV